MSLRGILYYSKSPVKRFFLLWCKYGGSETSKRRPSPEGEKVLRKENGYDSPRDEGNNSVNRLVSTKHPS